MATSAPGSRRRAQSGLTLVEVLVVIGVMALMTAVVIATAPPRASDAETAARAFARDVAALTDKSVATGRTVGLSGEGGLTVFAFGDVWAAERPIALPEDVEATLTAADEVLPPDPVPTGTLIIYRPPGDDAEPEPPAPPVLFGPTGEVTPFGVVFDGDGERWQVTVGAFGEAEVSRAR